MNFLNVWLMRREIVVWVSSTLEVLRLAVARKSMR